MAPRVVVLGAGYAGTAAVRSLEDEFEDADLVWVSEDPYHFVLHEAHRCIRDPDVREEITIAVDDIKSDGTRFVQGTVTDLDVDDREVVLDDDRTVDYDYAVVALGSETAFFGIDGLEEHALTLKSLDDALSIHEQIEDAARDGTPADPTQVVVGGAGLTGIQTAGEIAARRDELGANLDVHLVEMESHVFPGQDSAFQGTLRGKLEEADVQIHTDATCTAVDDDAMHFESGDDLAYDVLVWAGGVTGRDALDDADVETDRNRAYADASFKTSDDRVFAIGDSALVDQDTEEGPLTEEVVWQRIVNPDTDSAPPPTAEAAMKEGAHVGENIARIHRGEEPVDWAYIDKGTLVSVGDDVVAHDVLGAPVNTFSGPVARNLKRAVSARWLARADSVPRAAKAWSDM